jgi:uncharacterized protein DUF3489
VPAQAGPCKEDLVGALNLTDTQRVLLSAASQRDDGLIVRPDRLKGGAARGVAGKLVAAGLAEESSVAASAPHWREDQAGGRVGLKITPAGLCAIGVGDLPFGSGPRDGEGRPTLAPPASCCSSAPREGTKQALVLAMLQRDDGATLDEWVATTRAALVRLRRDHRITRAPEAGRRSVYRLENDEAAAATARGE